MKLLVFLLAVSGAVWAQDEESTSLDVLIKSNQLEEPTEAQAYSESIALEEPNELGHESSKAPPQRVIDEIVVTATKRAKSLREIPVSIARLGGEELESSGATGMAEYMSRIPGVSVNGGITGPDSNRVTVRGVGVETVNAITSNPAGIFIGDTPFNDPFAAYSSPDLHPFDLDGIEVLKGPQGTLFGGSALSGLVRYVPTQPDPARWSTKIYTSHRDVAQGESGHSLAAALNAPLADALAARVVAIRRQAPGVTDELLRGERDIDSLNQSGHRMMLAWEPSPGWNISATHLKQDSQMDDLGFADNANGDLSRDNTPEPSPTHSGFSTDNIRVSKLFDWAELVSSTSRVSKDLFTYQSYSRLAEPVVAAGSDSVFITIETESEGLLQELRLLSNGTTNWEWLVGAFGQRYRLQAETHLGAPDPLPVAGQALPLFPSAEDALVLVTDARVEELALFGELTWSAWDSLELNLGLRAFDILIDGYTEQSYENTPPERYAARIRERGVNPKLAMTWSANETWQLYAQVSKGFRYGGIQLVVATPADGDIPETYKSDTLWNYEMGVRTNWLNRALQADATVFYVDWNEAQLSQRSRSGIGNFVDNIAAATNKGLELAVSWLPPINGLSVSFTGSYIDAKTAAPFNDANGDLIPPGTVLPGSSRVSHSETIQYLGGMGGISIEADITYSYQGRGFNTIGHAAEILGFGLWSAAFAVQATRWQYAPKVRFIGNNLADTRGIVNRYTDGGQTDTFYTTPRTAEIQLSWDF